MVFELNKAKVWGLSAGLSSRPDSRTRYWFLLQQLAPRETSHRSLAMFSIRGRRKGVVLHTLPTVDQRSHIPWMQTDHVDHDFLKRFACNNFVSDIPDYVLAITFVKNFYITFARAPFHYC